MLWLWNLLQPGTIKCSNDFGVYPVKIVVLVRGLEPVPRKG